MWWSITNADRYFESLPSPILVLLDFNTTLMIKIETWVTLMVFFIASWIVL